MGDDRGRSVSKQVSRGDVLLGPPSDLFRRMVGACRKKLAEYEFIRLQPRMARRGVFSEKDVEKLVLEDR